jgi:peptidyl-prolyl cis-trans isomerase SurA
LYSSNSEDFIEPLKGLILDSATKKVEAFVTQHKLKTESGYFTREERAVLRKLPWTEGVYSTENSGMYYLAWLKDILPAGPMSFEEARPSIISDYQGFLEKKWVEQLKRKYPVKVNEKGKQYILQQLQIP